MFDKCVGYPRVVRRGVFYRIVSESGTILSRRRFWKRMNAIKYLFNDEDKIW